MARKEMDCARTLRQIETAVGAAKIGLDIIDSKYSIRYIDPAWKKVYGEPAGKKCFRYFMGRSSVCPHCGVKEAFRTKKITVKEEILSREGNKPVRVTTVPFKDGGEWLVAETNVDITEIKHAEQSLRESEFRYKSFYDKNTDAIVVADSVTRRLIDCNQQALDLTGYSMTEIRSMRADQLHPQSAKRVAMESFSRMAGGKMDSVETEIIRKDGRVLAVSITVTPFRKDGKLYIFGIFKDISERKKFEEGLRQTSSILAATIESTFNGILVVDHNGRITQYNQMFVKMWKIPQHVLISRIDKKALAHILSQLKNPASFLKKVKYLYERPDQESYDVLEFKDGRVFERYSRPQRIGREIVGRVWTFHDITARKMAEDALAVSENEKRMIINNLTDLVVLQDREGRIIWSNDSVSKAFGKTPEELCGKICYEALHNRRRRCDPCPVRKAFATGKHFETETHSPDGRDWLIKGEPVKDASGKVMSVVEVATDITLRKQSEEIVRRSEKLYRTLAESARDIIFIIGTDYRYRYMNKFSAKHIHVNQSEVIGQPIDKFFPKGQARAFKAYLERVIRSGKTLDTTEKVTLKTGDEWLDTRLCPIKDDNGIVTAILGIGRDITIYKEAEAVLKRDRDELERLVGARSAELLESQDKLHKSRRLADVGRLSATIAHELRSPFAAIRTAGYNIKMKTKDPRLDSHLANIDKKILEADQIIKNLLYYSSIKPPHSETFYFCRMIDECVELSKQIYRGHKVSIKRICKCGRNFKIDGDSIQLKEVFNNLLNNAYEAFDDKGGKIEIMAKVDRKYIKVRIKDNGPGVELKDREKIFEPFFTTKARGMGLGLPLCSQIILLHNGTIKIGSKLGKGTIVEVKLPLPAKVEKSPKKVL